MTVKWLKQQ